MGIFDDKKYNELDWMSQAVQPIDSPLSAILDKLPNEIVFNYDKIMYHGIDNINVNDILRKFLSSNRIKVDVSWNEWDVLDKCFELQIGENVVLNLEEQTFVGHLALVKIHNVIEEDSLKRLLGVKGRSLIRDLRGTDCYLPRINEMLELLEKCDESLSSKSVNKKIKAITLRLGDIFMNNEWGIKSVVLSDKIGEWIAKYIKDGNLAALSNITRLKVITYKGGPIYSVEEV